MATREEIPTDLTIDFGDELEPKEFIDAVKSFFAYVEEVAGKKTEQGVDIKWAVKVKEGSCLVGFQPSSIVPREHLSAIYDTIEQDFNSVLKEKFSEPTVSEKAKNCFSILSRLTNREEKSKGVRLWLDRRPHDIIPDIADILDKYKNKNRKLKYKSFGSIEGRLYQIGDKSDTDKIFIEDILYPNPVSCIITGRILSTALKNFKRRVEITGLIHYKKDGIPEKIEAYHIEIFPENSDLPSVEDVCGIMDDL